MQGIRLPSTEKFLQRKYINLLLVLGLFILVFINIISFYQIKSWNNAQYWITHTYKVIETTNNMQNDLSLVESKQRYYLLSGDASYNQISINQLSNMSNYITQLQYLTRDNIYQQERVNSLIPLLSARVLALNQIYQISKTQGLQAGIKEVATGIGGSSEQIRQILREIIAAENQLLLERDKSASKHFNASAEFMIIGNVLSISIILLSYLLLSKQLSFRVDAEKKLRESEAELSYLAYYDPLTGLANRALFIKRLDEIVAIPQDHNINTAILFIGLDNFKSINNSLGHDLGDELLQKFAVRLSAIVRGDDIVSHLSGDEFAVVLTNIETIKDINIVAQKILHSTIEPIVIGNHKIFMTTSIGISAYPSNGIDTKSLMKNADIALHRAKELGKNNFQFCTPELTLETEKRALLDFHLHQALAHDEFVLHYQPKISLKDGKISGVEALMRWNRPQVGIINPSHFISLAESNGLIVPIGEWMLREVCLQGKKWEEAGYPPLSIAINVSTRQLQTSDFIKSVKNIIEETNFDPNLLEFEITESVLIDNSFDNLAVLRDLKQMGIQITIDDFGTGYSSLSYLNYLAIDKLKIDQSFIKEINSPDHNFSIINAIIVMAHSLNIHVIAEGVETSQQIEFLKKHNCDEVQGYYFSHPIPADEVEKFFTLGNKT